MKTKVKTILLSLLVMALWGSLFPCIKIGYSTLGIDGARVADVLMFAAIRFVFCGAPLCAFALLRRKLIALPSARSVSHVLWVGVFAIVLHYACTYIGLSMTDSSKTALLKQAAALIYVCCAFLFFKDEKFSIYKIIGGIVGFGGIIAINVNGDNISFSVGDLLILGASICTVVANIISRRSTQACAPIWITGISQFFGGMVLWIAALSMGGTLPQWTPMGVLVFLYICAASIIAYMLWYHILKTTELSKLLIIKFAEPLFACIFSAGLLGENIWRWQYLVSFLLISSGILLAHIQIKGKEENK